MVGHHIVLKLVEDYWAKSLPVNKGLYNFDRINIDFYRDSGIAFTAFQADEIRCPFRLCRKKLG